MTVIGVAKAYSTRAGAGPFPLELTGLVGQHLSEVGQEVGATSTRRRRVGMLGVPELRYADEPPFDDAECARPRLEMLPGWTEPLDDCRSWDDLPANARRYVERIESATGLSIASIGVGPDRAIVRRDLLA